MIVLESRIQNSRPNDPLSGPTYICGASMESYVSGYFLTIDDLQRLTRDFQVDCHDGFVNNDQSYIEEWLKKHEQIVKNK
jgi:hypothetical protein